MVLLIPIVVFGGLYLFVARAGAPISASRPVRLVLAAVAAPLFVTFASYQYAYSSGHYPWVSPIADVGLGVGVLVGLALFSSAGFRSWLAFLGAMAGYVVLASLACLVTGFATACGNGDCL